MVLAFGMKGGLFPHNRTFGEGLAQRGIRAGQASVVVSVDGSGDGEAIQEGINMLPKEGGVVYIKEGTYIISAKITFPNSNIKIIGAGNSTIIQTASAIDCFEIASTISNVEIESIKFEKTGAAGGYGIDHQGTNLTIRNCYFKNLEFGIYSGIGTVAKVIENYFDTCTSGILLSFPGNTSLYFTILDNTFDSNTSHGIYMVRINRCIISGNIIKSNAGDGININGGGFSTISDNITAYNTGDGIELATNTDRCSVIGNHSTNNTGWGINISAAGCDNNIISGNVCVSNSAGQIQDNGTNTLPNGAQGTTNLALDDLNMIT